MSPGQAIDKSFLPAASCELVILSDTHYLLRPELQGGEWESIRHFPARAERALRLAGALGADAVVHLGDVTHEYPETGEAARSRAGAQAQFAQLGLRPYVAPGNMDIGDKPDPTSPAEWVTPETLAAWHAAFGRSWLSFDVGAIHGVVLNSCIMNGPLPEADEQRRWLESDLAAHDGRRIALFMHHPPFFVDPGERAYGMYNSLDEPARGWLLGLLRRYRVELLFAGHTHFVALNRVDQTRLFCAPSTTTSRAGLPEAFTVCPPDRGRSDLAKLGFYLLRDTARGASVHLIRTGLEPPALDPQRAQGGQGAEDPRRLLLTATSRDLPQSRLGLVATHPLGHMTPGPTNWPSVVRQRVRDDWRPMACLELGARAVRVPESDLSEPSEWPRLALLRDEGVAIAAFWLWSPRLDLLALLPEHAGLVDEVEVIFPGAPLPDPSCLAQVARLGQAGIQVTLSTAIRAASAPGQYHRRTRIGYLPPELVELDQWLGRHGCRVARTVCRLPASPRPALPAGESPWEIMLRLRGLLPLRQAGVVDLALDLPASPQAAAPPGDGAAQAAVAEALCAAAALPGSRLWLAPLVDMDRSMDAGGGLLDRLSNPQPAAQVARTLNTILFAPLESTSEAYEPLPSPPLGQRVLAFAGQGRRYWLFPAGAGEGPPLTPGGLDALGLAPAGHLTCYHLAEATSEEVERSADAIQQALARAPGPTLLVCSK